jgi:hypothetical protein
VGTNKKSCYNLTVIQPTGETTMSNLNRDIAITTAFLYAGALQHADKLENASLKDRGIALDLWDDWGGHTGFVHACTDYAQAIESWLVQPDRADDNHPGVLVYELIEPLGAWLIDPASNRPDTAIVLQEFQRRYLEWIKDTDGIKPTDRVVAHDGTVIQEPIPTTARIITTKNYEISLDFDTTGQRGYFEHNTLGDERAGGLWYDENKNITDYDGVAELPKEVREALIADGFTSTEGCLAD